jgi:phosphoribosylaminoimidazole-succinocarboxamide synthase
VEVSVLGLAHLYRGKVRDLYEVDESHLLMVASDRLSAFDVVMAEPFPNKGRVLTALTDYWLSELEGDVPSARVSCDPAEIARWVPGFGADEDLFGRSTLVRRAEMIRLECIVRARLAGHAFEEYERTGTVHHMAVPAGLRLTDPFPEPMFCPSTKAEEGHDENVDLATAASIVGRETLEEAQEICLRLFSLAAAKTSAAGLVLADTKFELGYVDGRLVVCDEVITPDSSRIWPADRIVPGETPPSFDKQPFRDWLATLEWDQRPPPPAVPEDVVAETSARYVACYESVTGRSLSGWYGRSR